MVRINDLPKDIRDLAIENMASQNKFNPIIVKDGDKIDCFDWKASNEGFYFWSLVDQGRFVDAGLSLASKRLHKEEEHDKKPKMRGTQLHYENSTSKYDVIDICHDYGLNFNRGNVIKYVLRCGKKDDQVKELEKAVDYLQREIKILRDEREDSE